MVLTEFDTVIQISYVPDCPHYAPLNMNITVVRKFLINYSNTASHIDIIIHALITLIQRIMLH